MTNANSSDWLPYQCEDPLPICVVIQPFKVYELVREPSSSDKLQIHYLVLVLQHIKVYFKCTHNYRNIVHYGYSVICFQTLLCVCLFLAVGSRHSLTILV